MINFPTQIYHTQGKKFETNHIAQKSETITEEYTNPDAKLIKKRVNPTEIRTHMLKCFKL